MNYGQRASKEEYLAICLRRARGIFKGYPGDVRIRDLTTFWADLTIAEVYGEEAVRETFERVTRDWGQNYKYYTEFVLCLNHKIWRYYEKNETLARVYDTLWRKGDDYARDHYTGEAMDYYWQVTD